MFILVRLAVHYDSTKLRYFMVFAVCTQLAKYHLTAKFYLKYKITKKKKEAKSLREEFPSRCASRFSRW